MPQEREPSIKNAHEEFGTRPGASADGDPSEYLAKAKHISPAALLVWPGCRVFVENLMDVRCPYKAHVSESGETKKCGDRQVKRLRGLAAFARDPGTISAGAKSVQMVVEMRWTRGTSSVESGGKSTR